MNAFRKCFVLREVEIPMENLKAGDVFRLDGGPGDTVDPAAWNRATSDAQPCEPQGNVVVGAEPFNDIRSLAGGARNAS